MTHEVRYGSRNIGRHDDGDGGGGDGFAPRVLETGKVHGDGTADESTVESAHGDHIAIVITLERDSAREKRRCEIEYKAEQKRERENGAQREKRERERERWTVPSVLFTYAVDGVTFFKSPSFARDTYLA